MSCLFFFLFLVRLDLSVTISISNCSFRVSTNTHPFFVFYVIYKDQNRCQRMKWDGANRGLYTCCAAPSPAAAYPTQTTTGMV
ncbi:hypothetical protein STCU_10584 [Strigomonas culicis]|uniref:Secreted protein n=1 Tax=Strigomonas culicis TaxID=28005 RepID=S9V3R9_9TRYP|nr:hypothetical protein STCU_10584 [Strigomonas culicis]|eukprot:EPY17500.1 hypothetical protein STCU_10584 [Strigomonas culicis]